jgi:hypothetical protein
VISCPSSNVPAVAAVQSAELFQLVYVSSATVRFATADLVELLRLSRERNTARGITGLLVYHDGNFMQAIEGPEAAVRALHARIVEDPRHGGCITLTQKRVDERTFPEWSMGFRDLTAADLSGISGYSDYLNATGVRPFPPNASHAWQLLESFRTRLR